jgi:putative membrane protein
VSVLPLEPWRPAPGEILGWCLIFLAVLVWSAWRPYETGTWFLEVVPALIAIAVLAATRSRFPLTRLAYWLILAHALVLMVGGHYTYARVPVGDWFAELLDLRRNHYDRLGHLMQGFVPAIVVREVLLRLTPLRRGAWLALLVLCVCLAISALYELIEWWVALLSAEAAESFLGTQGDLWDTQADMLFCLLGAMASLALLGRAHDRGLRRLGVDSAP